MSKELTPLEALERIKSRNYHELPKKECLRIIETALKERICLIQMVCKLTIGIQKQEKILQIIKNKRVNFDQLMDFLTMGRPNYKKYLNLNKQLIVLKISEEDLTKEEYDLLKEMLL